MTLSARSASTPARSPTGSDVGRPTASIPVHAENADSTIAALAALFDQFGPPLVLKSDNGAAFTADATRRFLARQQVWPLFSPPYTPEYNGACEAGIGGLKNRTHYQAALAGHPDRWTSEDGQAKSFSAQNKSVEEKPLQELWYEERWTERWFK